jgi:hypothetical protein
MTLSSPVAEGEYASAVTYDDAEWHMDSVLDLGLDESAAAVHVGIFLAWATTKGLLDDELDVRTDAVRVVAERSVTPSALAGRYFVSQIDPFMLNTVGNGFADTAYRHYLVALESDPMVARNESIYHVPDSWDSYDAIAPVIDALYARWLADD